eukprot:TRINITY_DN7520_c0_g1_i1.p2 TRINITY_DN7520_c0_g1~~TRINITY_DN7520_c0_g1_i1.p2  ORF type:complete len:337 (+),score=102.22 TRINITY_DN7520_c0_g1_i1:78-1088(+)
MGKKKDKLKAKQAQQEKNATAEKAGDVKTDKKTPAKAEAKAEGKAESKKRKAAEPETVQPADSEQPEERDENVFKASAVVFFTRDKDNKVSKVLMALEERKVSASWLGLDTKGKVLQKMVMFPMGRRERKDKSDTVETAKREYIEETGDYGGLSQYLDFAVFDGEDLGVTQDAEKAVKEGAPWSGKGNMALFFAPASMIVLFCEVPEGASLKTQKDAEGGVNLAVLEARKKKEAEEAAKEPAGKKRKAKPAKPSPTYHVGQMDHLEPAWVDIQRVKQAMTEGGRAPPIEGFVGDFRIFPVCASILRMPEVRDLMGMPRPADKTDDSAPAVAEPTST